MSTPPGKNVTHKDRDPALVAAEKNLRYVVHDGEWKVFWALEATYYEALRLKERVAGTRECRTVTMEAYTMGVPQNGLLQRVAEGKPGATADAACRSAIERIKLTALREAQRATVTPAPPVTVPELPPVVIGGREVPRTLTSVPAATAPAPVVVAPPAPPAPRPAEMPAPLVVAPPAPQPAPPAPAPGPACDACGASVPADLPETDGLRICESCKAQDEFQDRPIEDLV